MSYKDDARNKLNPILSDIRGMVTELDLISLKIGELRTKHDALEEKISRGVTKVDVLWRKMLFSAPLQKIITDIRDRIMRLQEQEGSEEVTIKEHKRVKEEKNILAQQLQSVCAHPILIGFRGYEGSRSYDYDDQYCGRRMCVVCGIGDRDLGGVTDDNYKVLSAEPCGFSFYSSAHANLRMVPHDRVGKLISHTGMRILILVSRERFESFRVWRSFEEIQKELEKEIR